MTGLSLNLHVEVHNQSCLVSQRENELLKEKDKLNSLIEMKEWHNDYKSKKLSKSFYVWLEDTNKELNEFQLELI
jgi:hypothetical protein